MDADKTTEKRGDETGVVVRVVTTNGRKRRRTSSGRRRKKKYGDNMSEVNLDDLDDDDEKNVLPQHSETKELGV
jgi:hypothetical protein